MPRANLDSQTVIAAAVSLADRDGFGAVSVSLVARCLGVKSASLYEHVRGRDALLDGMQRFALGELAARISDAIAGRSATDALRGLADAHLAYARERPGAWAALARHATVDTARSVEAQRVASLLLAAIRGYPVPDEERVHAVRFVGATVRGFLSLTRVDAFAHRDDSQDESWTAAIDALDRALFTWPVKGVDT
jgi:AcrR family transcriptional regulator